MNSHVSLAAVLLVVSGCGPFDPTDAPTPGGTSGGSGSSSGRVYYKVTRVEGTYGGSSAQQMAAFTDYLSHSVCRFSSPGSAANQSPFINDPSRVSDVRSVRVAGDTQCGSTVGTSTDSKACTGPAWVKEADQFYLTIVADGWKDDSVVALHARTPAALPLPCNFASLLDDEHHPWGLEAKTTLGKFRGSAQFEVRFAGEKMLADGKGNTSKVSWDITLTITPVR